MLCIDKKTSPKFPYSSSVAFQRQLSSDLARDVKPRKCVRGGITLEMAQHQTNEPVSAGSGGEK